MLLRLWCSFKLCFVSTSYSTIHHRSLPARRLTNYNKNFCLNCRFARKMSHIPPLELYPGRTVRLLTVRLPLLEVRKCCFSQSQTLLMFFPKTLMAAVIRACGAFWYFLYDNEDRFNLGKFIGKLHCIALTTNSLFKSACELLFSKNVLNT